jgi:hypothetical protein
LDLLGLGWAGLVAGSWWGGLEIEGRWIGYFLFWAWGIGWVLRGLLEIRWIYGFFGVCDIGYLWQGGLVLGFEVLRFFIVEFYGEG